jgi:hypothetical protein
MSSSVKPVQNTSTSFEMEHEYQVVASSRFSYVERNALKARFRLQSRLDGLLRRTMFDMAQDLWTIPLAFLKAPQEAFSYLAYRLWGYSADRGWRCEKYFPPTASTEVVETEQAHSCCP